MKTRKAITTAGRLSRATGLLLGVCLATLALTCTAPAAEQTGPDKLPLGASRTLYKAQQQFNKADYRQCCLVLEAYLQAHPDKRYRSFALLQGNSYFKMDAFKQAESAYRQGLKLAPRDPMLNLNLALSLEQAGQLQPAGEQYVRAYGVQAQPDPQLLYRAAALLSQTKRYRRAAALLEQLGQDHPPAREEWLQLLLYDHYQLHDYPAAIRVTEQLISRQPEKTDSWEQLAQLRLHGKQYLAAAAAYEVLYRLRTPSRQELEQLADLYQYLALPLRAAQTLARNDPKDRTRADLEHLAELYRQGGQLAKADRCLSRILERWPDARAYRLKAELLYGQNAYRKALELLDAACAKYPQEAELHLQRGFAAWQLEDWDRAVRSFAAARRFKRTRPSAAAALQILDALRSEAAAASQTPVPPAPLAAGLY